MRSPIEDFQRDLVFDSGEPVPRIRDFVLDALPEAEQVAARLSALREQEVSDPASVVLSMASHVGFSQPQREAILRRVTPEVRNMYDVVNLFTAYANGLPVRIATKVQDRAGHAARVAQAQGVCTYCHSVLEQN